MFNTVLSNLISLFVCIGIGYFCKKKNIIDDKLVNGLTILLIEITLPCTILVSMQQKYSKDLLIEMIMIFFVSFLIFFIGTFVGYSFSKLFKVEKSNRNIWMFAMTFSNVGYMGIPVITSIYGEKGLFYVAIINMSFNILAYTYGIKLINTGSENNATMNISKIVKMPVMIATVIGFLLFIFSLNIEPNINKGISMIGAMTTPISMILIGAILSRSKVKEVLEGWKNYIIVILRLLIYPICVFFVLRIFIKNEIILSILVLTTAMPSASLLAIFAAKYETNVAMASKIVFLTTSLSLITLPIIALIIGGGN